MNNREKKIQSIQADMEFCFFDPNLNVKEKNKIFAELQQKYKQVCDEPEEPKAKAKSRGEL